MDKQRIIKTLNLTGYGQKGWLRSDLIECPDCKHNDKIGVLFTEKSGIVKCMRCGYVTSLYNLLVHLDKRDLLSSEYQYSQKENLPNIFEKEKIVREIKIVKKPLGYKEIKYDEYLLSRKFVNHHYDIFKPGVATLEPHLNKNYLVFLLYQNKQLVGWLARSKKSKEWHKKNLKLAKEGKARLQLRWKNSPDTEFSMILGGYDEITDRTDTLILVEGLFDKTSVDRILKFYSQDEMKCNFTFGDSISIDQIKLIEEKKSIKNVILFYDYNTIKESKSAAMMLLKKVSRVWVCDIKKDTDPGEMSEDEIALALISSLPAMKYYENKLKKIKF